MFVCLVFLLVSGLGSFALAGAVESEERAEAACEWLLETDSCSRTENRLERFEHAREFGYLRFVRLAGHRVGQVGRGRIRCCETAPLPLRC